MFIAPVILGIDFFQQHRLVLDFTESTVQIYRKHDNIPYEIQSIWDTAVQQKAHIKTIAAIGESLMEITTDCAIPDYGATVPIT